MMTTNMRLTEGYTMLTEPLHTTGPFISYTRVTTLTMGARKEWSCEKNVYKKTTRKLNGHERRVTWVGKRTNLQKGEPKNDGARS